MTLTEQKRPTTETWSIAVEFDYMASVYVCVVESLDTVHIDVNSKVCNHLAAPLHI